MQHLCLTHNVSWHAAVPCRKSRKQRRGEGENRERERERMRDTALVTLMMSLTSFPEFIRLLYQCFFLPKTYALYSQLKCKATLGEHLQSFLWLFFLETYSIALYYLFALICPLFRPMVWKICYGELDKLDWIRCNKSTNSIDFSFFCPLRHEIANAHSTNVHISCKQIYHTNKYKYWIIWVLSSIVIFEIVEFYCLMFRFILYFAK